MAENKQKTPATNRYNSDPISKAANVDFERTKLGKGCSVLTLDPSWSMHSYCSSRYFTRWRPAKTNQEHSPLTCSQCTWNTFLLIAIELIVIPNQIHWSLFISGFSFSRISVDRWPNSTHSLHLVKKNKRKKIVSKLARTTLLVSSAKLANYFLRFDCSHFKETRMFIRSGLSPS